MNIYKHRGSCHCGNITLTIDTVLHPSEIYPRACDCDFCRKHGAAYVSDPSGSLSLWIENMAELVKYRQGSEIAEFLLCKRCGVLVAACYEWENHLYATVNMRVMDDRESLGLEKTVSPRLLGNEGKIQRWKDVWFSNVSVSNI